MAHHTIALIFDFDDTLVDDSTTALLVSKGVDVDDFWRNKARGLIEDGYDPVHAYLKLLLDMTRDGQPLAGLTDEDLRSFGATLKPYKGLPKFFDYIKKSVAEHSAPDEIEVQFWVISGGLEEIIRGCTQISSHLTGFWGCRLGADTPGGALKHIKRAISFTEKTRFVFEINKGLPQEKTDTNPYLVNKDIHESKRKVPFSQMIYVGDGLTDIPCFSLIKKNRGMGFAIIQPDVDGNPKQATFKGLLTESRVLSMHSPAYTQKADLAMMIRTGVMTIVSDLLLRDKNALD